MFDEPFAALTAAESSLLFTSCILEHLAGCTRILVTQQLELLERADHIVCMTDAGGILCCGSYAELSSKHPEVFSSISKKRRSLSDVGMHASAAAHFAVPSVTSGIVSFANSAAPRTDSAVYPASAVSPESYKFYLEIIGRNRAIVAGVLVGLSQLSRVLSYLWIAHWVQVAASDPSLQMEYNYYITVFGSLIATSSVLMMLRDACLSVTESQAATRVHSRTLRSLLRAPLSFFSTTPASNMVSHLTVGQDAIDTGLPRAFNFMLNGFTAVLCALLVVTSIAWPFALIPMFIAYYYFKTAQLYRPASRELKRLQATIEPRISSLLSEAYSGSRIIRAFGLVDSFFTEIENRVDALNRVVLPHISVVRWLGVRMELCANLIVTFSCVAAVLAPKYYPGYWPGYAALIGFALSEAFGVKDIVLHSVRCYLCIDSSFFVSNVFVGEPLERIRRLHGRFGLGAAVLPDRTRSAQ
jgi:ABC-type multidrug transport system fused ATPase/permease subunit